MRNSLLRKAVSFLLPETLPKTPAWIYHYHMARPPKDIRTKRDNRSGRYLVGYLEDPGHWYLSPEVDAELAIRWAKRNRDRLLQESVHPLTLADLVRGMFDKGSPWRSRMELKGHKLIEKSYANREALLRLYILPLFGDEDPRKLTRRYVDETLVAAHQEGRLLAARGNQKTGEPPRPLSPATMNKILYTMNLALEDLVDRGILERNPIDGIKQYSKTAQRPRGALPREALEALFPAGHGNLVRIWGSSMWAAGMCLLLDTGMRPGELRALRWGQIDTDARFIPVRYGIESGTVDQIKETKTGIVRAAFVTYRTAQELRIWRAESRFNGADDFVFTQDGATPITGEGVISAFRRGVRAAGFDKPDWTPYWLRHSFGTYRMAELEDWELQMLMGHTNIVTNAIYRHPDDEIVRTRALSVQRKLDEAREKKG